MGDQLLSRAGQPGAFLSERGQVVVPRPLGSGLVYSVPQVMSLLFLSRFQIVSKLCRGKVSGHKLHGVWHVTERGLAQLAEIYELPPP